MNVHRIKEALAYVHYWEKKGQTRKEAAEYIARTTLTKQEKDILFRALHLTE